MSAEETGRYRRRLVIGSVIALTLVIAAAFVVRRGTRLPVVEGDGFRLAVIAQVRTGHQRAERLVFLDGGRRLAVACPRYNRVVVYRVDTSSGLVRDLDLKLDGKPVALAGVVGADHAGETLLVLQRPSGDARHVEEAWLDRFDPSGQPLGSRSRLGFDPDDLAILPDRNLALVLRSGRAEGEANRPPPSLLLLDVVPSGNPFPRGAVRFDDANDDPERVAVSDDNQTAVVTLRGSREIARVNLGDPQSPRLLGRIPFPPGAGMVPAGVAVDMDGAILFSDEEGNGPWRIDNDGAVTPIGTGLAEFVEVERPAAPSWLIGLSPADSTLELWEAGRRLARLSLADYGEFRPMGLAVQELDDRTILIAISDRSGGVVLARLVPRIPFSPHP